MFITEVYNMVSAATYLFITKNGSSRCFFFFLFSVYVAGNNWKLIISSNLIVYHRNSLTTVWFVCIAYLRIYLFIMLYTMHRCASAFLNGWCFALM